MGTVASSDGIRSLAVWLGYREELSSENSVWSTRSSVIDEHRSQGQYAVVRRCHRPTPYQHSNVQPLQRPSMDWIRSFPRRHQYSHILRYALNAQINQSSKLAVARWRSALFALPSAVYDRVFHHRGCRVDIVQASCGAGWTLRN